MAMHGAVPSHERWLVSYADFMTLLFAFFVVLFASSRHNNQALHQVAGSIHEGFAELSAYPRGNEDPGTRNGVLANGSTRSLATTTENKPVLLAPTAAQLDLSELQRQLQELLRDPIARHEVVVQRSAAGLMISFRELGFFDSGRARLLPGAADKIVRTARLLMQHPFEVKVEGHSDDQPIHNAAFQSNWELSSARAMTVLLLLIDQGGFDPARVALAAYGPYHALADNGTPEGRRMNRRVDLLVDLPGLPGRK